MTPDYEVERERAAFAKQTSIIMEKIQKMLEETKRIEAELRNEPIQKEEIVGAIASGVRKPYGTPLKRARL
jgi:hypothetical protein